jgi:hypothetical protein
MNRRDFLRWTGIAAIAGVLRPKIATPKELPSLCVANTAEEPLRWMTLPEAMEPGYFPIMKYDSTARGIVEPFTGSYAGNGESAFIPYPNGVSPTWMKVVKINERSGDEV